MSLGAGSKFVACQGAFIDDCHLGRVCVDEDCSVLYRCQFIFSTLDSVPIVADRKWEHTRAHMP